jgi:hypothetical protein
MQIDTIAAKAAEHHATLAGINDDPTLSAEGKHQPLAKERQEQVRIATSQGQHIVTTRTQDAAVGRGLASPAIRPGAGTGHHRQGVAQCAVRSYV